MQKQQVMKIQIETNGYQASRNHLFANNCTTAILKEGISIREGKDLLQQFALESDDNYTLLDNGDVYDTENEYVVYSYGDRSFSEDGYYYSLTPNN